MVIFRLALLPASYEEGKQAWLDDEPGFSLASWQQRPERSGLRREQTIRILLKNQ